MKTAHATLILAAVGAIGVGLSHRHHRQQLDLQAVAMHQAWLQEAVNSPKLQELWATAQGELSAEEHVDLWQANRVIAFLCAKFRVGLLTKDSLRVQARHVMKVPVGRRYWEIFGAFREEEATDSVTRRFNAIMNDEYAAVSGSDALAA
ncbi:DUF6082 family protein [Streptomyces hundungensis]|uniref:DUF6082 family protein n=1 Tax=Streptomyces hundungensis TaxID=1077946 RepID=UPI0033FA625D